MVSSLTIVPAKTVHVSPHPFRAICPVLPILSTLTTTVWTTNQAIPSIIFITPALPVS